ncbi:MAG: NTP transferase domain-containing protein [Thiotrichales bacterium]|nr:NTP transferase domain-containing protein [Thiotrichales bacterium]
MIGVVILAGGEGKRMGGQDKGWCVYQEQAFIEWVLQGLQKQAQALDRPVQIVVSANRNLAAYRAFGYPVIRDLRKGFTGPLAGIEAALTYGQAHNIQQWISCPVDCLQPPSDYLLRMLNAPNSLAFWRTREAEHYAHLRISLEALPALQRYLLAQRSLQGFLKRYDACSISSLETKELGPHFNCNFLREQSGILF